MNWLYFNAATREQKADFIQAEPKYFVVCNGCESVLGFNTKICPKCHSYNFATHPAIVQACAEVLKTKEPDVAVLPRY